MKDPSSKNRSNTKGGNSTLSGKQSKYVDAMSKRSSGKHKSKAGATSIDQRSGDSRPKFKAAAPFGRGSSPKASGPKTSKKAQVQAARDRHLEVRLKGIAGQIAEEYPGDDVSPAARFRKSGLKLKSNKQRQESSEDGRVEVPAGAGASGHFLAKNGLATHATGQPHPANSVVPEATG